MVWREQSPVLLVGQDDIAGRVHGLGPGDGGAIGTVITLGQLAWQGGTRGLGGREWEA